MQMRLHFPQRITVGWGDFPIGEISGHGNDLEFVKICGGEYLTKETLRKLNELHSTFAVPRKFAEEGISQRKPC